MRHRVVQIRTFRTVINASKIINEIDNKLTNEPTRTVEFIFTKPAWKLIFSRSIFESHSSVNPYGHAGIRYYDRETGRNIVMNVSNTPLINFFDADKYLFSDEQAPGNGQCGVYNRSFLAIRIENIDPERIAELHQFYIGLQKQSLKGDIKYGMLLYFLTNPIRKFMGFSMKGNCSYWTGQGLAKIGLINSTSSWPLLLWFKLLFNQMEHNPNNINIVAYPSINYKNEPSGSLLAPKIGLTRGYSDYWDLNSFANIKVKINPNDSYQIKEYQHVRQRWQETKEKMKEYIHFKQ